MRPEIGQRFTIARGDDYGRTVEVVGFDHRGFIVCASVIPERVGDPSRWINPDFADDYLRHIDTKEA